MASIKKRGNKFVVIYDYRDEKNARHQKWENFFNKEDAIKFKKKIELDKVCNQMLTPSSQTVEEFLLTWAKLYGKGKWSYSMCATSLSLIRNHIVPEIGRIPLQRLQPLQIEEMYDSLRKKNCLGAKSHAEDESRIPCLSSTTIRHVHTLLKTALDTAVEWKLLDSSPIPRNVPKKSTVERSIWTPDMMRAAMADMEHTMLHLAVHLAFICSLRIGETVALTWDDVDFERSTIRICKTLQRVSRESLSLLPKDELSCEFPPKVPDAASLLILKRPKTKCSERLVYMTPVLRRELLLRQQQTAKEKAFIGGAYGDYNLVFCLEDGYPVEPKLCEKWFKKWQKHTTLHLPPLIFHKIRHSSATYKLQESGGDLKTVQGDLGHASAGMTLDTYAHTQDESRLDLSRKIARDFYAEDSGEVRQERLLELLADDPEMKKRLLDALLAESSKSVVCSSVSSAKKVEDTAHKARTAPNYAPCAPCGDCRKFGMCANLLAKQDTG